MTFAFQIKNEIYNKSLRLRKDQARVYGLLLCARHFDSSQMSLATEHRGVARLYGDSISTLVGLEGSITMRSQIRAGRETFLVQVDSAADRRRVLDFFSQQGDEIQEAFLQSPEAIYSFLAGAYLACGNINDPEKSYRLEFSLPRTGLADSFSRLLESVGFAPKVSIRRGLPVIYFKDSEQIEELTAAMGASKQALEIMNIKIYKDIRNRANRQSNCDTANIDKTIAAGQQQVADIRLIIAQRGLGSLPEDLQQMAQVRLDHPEASLRELSELMGGDITRSGINHRLKRISAIAEELRQKQKINA